MKKLLFFTIFLFFSNIENQAQNQSIALTQALQKLSKTSKFVGFSVAIVSKDSVLYQNAFGFSDKENKILYTTQTVQNIASVSKTFIGVCLMKAIELDYFNLETNINEILPFQVVNPNFIEENIQIKHLATHTSGIVDREEVYYKNFILTPFSDTQSPLYQHLKEKGTIQNRTDTTLATFLKAYFDKKGKWYSKKNFIKSKVGETYEYSNIGAALAAYLIEVKAKMSFADFCKKYVLQPLQMNQTSWFLTPNMAKKHSKIYNYKGEAYPLYSEITYPDGGLRTSCEDLSKYLLAMLKGYNGQSDLLKKQSFEQLFAKQFSDNNLPKNNSKKEPNSGIFWRYKTNGMIGHTGGDLGATAFLFFDPKTNIGKIFIANTEVDSPEQAEPDEEMVKQFVEIWKTLDNLTK
jgi:CubicO group peptidase (beta-lactamase class C family)